MPPATFIEALRVLPARVFLGFLVFQDLVDFFPTAKIFQQTYEVDGLWTSIILYCGCPLACPTTEGGLDGARRALLHGWEPRTLFMPLLSHVYPFEGFGWANPFQDVHLRIDIQHL